MEIRTEVKTTVYDARGRIRSEVTTTAEASVGDNPRLLRDAIAGADTYGRASSINLDAVVASVR